VQLAFSLSINKHPTLYKAVFSREISEATIFGVNDFPTIIFTDIQSTNHNAVTTVCQAVIYGISFPFRTELVAEITICENQKAEWKESL